MEYRMEHDSMGDVRVPADRYWGAQTQRSFENFPIGQGREPMPPEIIHAFGILKKAAAITNARLCPTAMTAEKCGAICAAADEIISGKLADHFPLVVWQTGPGTQTKSLQTAATSWPESRCCTRMTTSIARNPPTTPSPQRCILRPFAHSKTASCPH